MSDLQFREEYLQHVDEAIKSAKRTADRTMFQFVGLRLLMVLASASLPALVLLDHKIWPTIAAVLVAVLAGLDTQFQWGEEWRHFRSTQLALERCRRDYERRGYLAAAGGALGSPTSDLESFSRFFDEVESLLQSEADRFFKFRITAWQAKAATGQT